jgi:glycosyltransferase involved in cell wall biosynthesis
MFPGRGNRDENRYIDVLVKSLRDAGVEVEDWDKHFSQQSGDIFHVHWPEVVADIRRRKYQLLRGQWIAMQFFRTIRRIKKQGGRVVWTVHGLAPHDRRIHGSRFLARLMSKFISRVDAGLSLTSAGIADIKQRYPGLRQVPIYVTRHPHYQGVLGAGAYRQDVRERLGVVPDQKVFVHLGTLRSDKRPELVVQAFRELPTEGNFLILAGSASPEMRDTITGLAGNRGNIKLDLRRIPEKEVVELYSAADILVFPGTDYFNSGTIYTALSLGVPVVAAWSATNQEIQGIVGSQWLHLYHGDLSRAVLDDAAKALVHRSSGALCDMSAFSPETCAAQHIAAYERALSLPPHVDYVESRAAGAHG